MQSKKQHRFYVKTGILISLLSFLFLFLFRSDPELCERLYGQWFYPGYQSVRAFISQIIPNGILFYVPFFLLFFLVVRLITRLVKGKLKFLQAIGHLVLLVCLFVSWFYIFWGYNYSRPSLEARMNLSIETPDSTYIFEDLAHTVSYLNAVRSQISTVDTIAWYDDSFTKNIRNELSDDVATFISDYGYKTGFRGFVHELKPKGVLRRFGSSGMFLPWSGEAYFDSAVPNVSRPNTFAHELSHVYGVTNEGESNFVAYRACMASKFPLVRYSGALSYYRYAARTAYRTDSVAFRRIEQELDSLVVADIRSKRRCGLLYPDFFPKARDAFYDGYLKTQGVKTGLKDYSKLYLIEHAWRRKNGIKYLDSEKRTTH